MVSIRDEFSRQSAISSAAKSALTGLPSLGRTGPHEINMDVISRRVMAHFIGKALSWSKKFFKPIPQVDVVRLQLESFVEGSAGFFHIF